MVNTVLRKAERENLLWPKASIGEVLRARNIFSGWVSIWIYIRLPSVPRFRRTPAGKSPLGGGLSTLTCQRST